MKPDEFMKLQQNKINEDIYPPTDAQEGLDILIKHFLGDDWSTTITCNAQANTEAIYQILSRYPKKESLLKRIFRRK